MYKSHLWRCFYSPEREKVICEIAAKGAVDSLALAPKTLIISLSLGGYAQTNIDLAIYRQIYWASGVRF